MRTALILLFLLALGAVPGSVIPQQAVDSLRTSGWKTAHPTLTPIYERLGLFNVFGSSWFAAIYLMLAVSLVGCILPRMRIYWRGLVAKPPAAPRNLLRLPEHRSWESHTAPEEILEQATNLLRRRQYRLAPGLRADDTGLAIAAERGYLREAGNLLFHVSVLVVLAGVAIGSLFGFKGGVIVIVGDSFANTVSQYDDFAPGGLFNPDRLQPFNLKVDQFHVNFIRSGRSAGAAQKFYADLRVRSSPTAVADRARISVNHPLTVGQTSVFLIGHGYAPHITVRDGQGNVAYSGATVFLPERQDLTSYGVVKVPDAKPTQLGLEGEFYPTYAFTPKTGPFTAFPDAKNPAISMLVYSGDLNLDAGLPQSIYTLDKSGLKPVMQPNGRPLRVDLALGGTKTLPNGMGSVSFDGLSRFVRLQVSKTPGTGIALSGMVLALIGLLGSLFVRPRRIWLRVRSEQGRSIIELAGLDRSSNGNLAEELQLLEAGLKPVHNATMIKGAPR